MKKRILKTLKCTLPLAGTISLIGVASCSENKPVPPSDVKVKKVFDASCINADKGSFTLEIINNKNNQCILTSVSNDFTAEDFNFNDGIVSTNDEFEYTITSIGDECFKDCLGLKGNITIPHTIKTIGKSAFMGAGITGNVIINENIESIDESAFANTKIDVLDLSKYTKHILKYAKDIVTGSTLVYVPTNFLNEYKTAEGWKDLDSKIIVKPDPIPPQPEWTKKTIDAQIIHGSYGTIDILYSDNQPGKCWLLKASSDFTAVDLTFGKFTMNTSTGSQEMQIVGICDECFKDCKNLKGWIQFSPSIKEIRKDAFNGCSNIVSIEFKDSTTAFNQGIQDIYANAFKGTKVNSYIRTQKLPKSIKHIGNNAFENSFMETLDLSALDHVISINSNPFDPNNGFLANTKVSKILLRDQEMIDKYTSNAYWTFCKDLFAC